MLYYSIYVCFQAACGRNSTSWPSAAGLPQDFQVRVCEETQGWPDSLGDLSYLKSFILHYPRWRDMKDSAPSFPQHVMNVSSQTFRKHHSMIQWQSSRRHWDPREAWSTYAAPVVASCFPLLLLVAAGELQCQHITIPIFMNHSRWNFQWELAHISLLARPREVLCQDSSEVGRWNYQQLGCHCKLLGGSW